MKIQKVKPADLCFDENNARVHNDVNMRSIADSLGRFGQVEPLVVQKSTKRVIGGNGRLKAMIDLGWDSCEAVFLDLDDEESDRLALALNRTAELAGWDKTVLSEVLQGLPDLDATGFSQKDLEELLKDKPVRDSATEPPPDSPIVSDGDVWKVGEHRIACGDSTSGTLLAALLGDRKPRLCVTDPPYGVDYDPGHRTETSERRGAVLNDDRADWSDTFALLPSDVFYVWHAGVWADVVYQSLRKQNIEVRAQIIWVKPKLVMARGHYNYQHEPCVYGVRKGATSQWVGEVGGSATVWNLEVDEDVADCTHSTQKPLEAMARPIRFHSGNVIDPFLGSGTTLVAAHSLGRVGYGIELSPGYCEAAIRRLVAVTGTDAVRESDGERIGAAE